MRQEEPAGIEHRLAGTVVDAGEAQPALAPEALQRAAPLHEAHRRPELRRLTRLVRRLELVHVPEARVSVMGAEDLEQAPRAALPGGLGVTLRPVPRVPEGDRRR